MRGGWHDEHFHLRHFVHPKNTIVIEIRLPHLAILKADAAPALRHSTNSGYPSAIRRWAVIDDVRIVREQVRSRRPLDEVVSLSPRVRAGEDSSFGSASILCPAC